MECQRRRISDVRHPGGMSVGKNFGCETSEWNMRCHTSQGGRLRVQGVGTPPPDDTERTSLSGATPSGFSKRICGALPYPDSLRKKHTALAIITPWTIAYPIRICCPDHWLKCTSLATSFQQPTTANVPLPSDGVSGRPVRTSFAMDSKEYSSISDCFGDQKAIKTPKLNTHLIRIDCKGP